MAATRMSASRVTAGRSRVREWQTVTVASACRRSRAIGLPTMSLRPSTTARRPATAMPLRASSSMIPAGVQATKRGRFCTRQAHVLGVEAVHVLGGVHQVEHARGVHLRRQRELDQDAVDLRPAVVVLDRARHLRGGRGRGQAHGLVVEAQLLAQARVLLRT